MSKISGFPGFSLTKTTLKPHRSWPTPVYGVIVVSKHDFFEVKNRGVKTEHFDEKAYLNPISFTEMSIFDVFASFDSFWDPLKHHFLDTVKTAKTVKNHLPNLMEKSKIVKTRNFMKNTENTTFLQNPSKCHRQTWHLEKSLFRLKSVFFVFFLSKTTLKSHRSWPLRDQSCPIDVENPTFRWFSVIFRDFRWFSGIFSVFRVSGL